MDSPSAADHSPSTRRGRCAAVAAVLGTCAAAFIGLAGTAIPAAASQTHAAAEGTGARIVEAAAAQAGDPYSYGADGPDAFDCSGLVQYAHQRAGVSVPRTSQAQRNALAQVADSAKRPGDVIFFSNGSGVYHSAIYAGDGEIWTAPQAGEDVQRDAIWTSSYSVGRAQ